MWNSAPREMFNRYFSWIDLWLQYNFAIEIDELGHNVRNTEYEIKRQREIEKELNCAFIRANPDAADFNMNTLKN